MRIVAGKYKSRIIKAPNGNNTRPSMDKTREAIFNVINFYLPNANVLDIFSGSGALGIEALSRGAKKVTFVDNNFKAVLTLKENLKSLNIFENVQIYQNDYKIINDFKEKFDLVLLDPPYALDCFEDIFNILINKNLLNENALIVYESDKNHYLKENYEGFDLKIKNTAKNKLKH